jgi:hypothetical protein
MIVATYNRYAGPAMPQKVQAMRITDLMELCGGRLDHEHHEMSENRETTNADMQQAIPGLVADIAPFDDAQGRLWQGGRFHAFSHECCTMCNIRVKKKKVPCCRRRVRFSSGQTPGLNTRRVISVIDRSYAVVDLAGDSASGRAEEIIFFTKNLHLVQIFGEKDQKVPCCRRRIGLPPGQMSSLWTHRVSRVIDS